MAHARLKTPWRDADEEKNVDVYIGWFLPRRSYVFAVVAGVQPDGNRNGPSRRLTMITRSGNAARQTASDVIHFLATHGFPSSSSSVSSSAR
jgi:hypothetical protein